MKNYAKTKTSRLLLNLFFYIKALHKIKASSQHHSVSIFWQTWNWRYNKNKHCNLSDRWSRDMPNFDFLWKGLWHAFPSYFVCSFSRKIFLILYSIDWPNLIVFLALLPEILDNMSVVTVYFPVWDVLNFGINLSFLIKPISIMVKKSRTKN